MMTINISLPKSMYEDAKKAVKQKRFASISEFVRDSMRKSLYPDITENGFTKEFEDMVLKASAESMENDTILETDEDIRNYFLYLKKPKKHAKG